ncbi:hypothetical protein [Microcoleus sp. bin38.metabat.b11b12b14.051]|uniref:hypothetical protein n=1 Tax=Microcoleus sp. bin38.metabat.b11b12b14.051 TaxID=2742709 RepID=UPI0025F35456|nr:hypothetical protein [Microcoleus sp. bin38.metabat.b11b12b14.051]
MPRQTSAPNHDAAGNSYQPAELALTGVERTAPTPQITENSIARLATRRLRGRQHQPVD